MPDKDSQIMLGVCLGEKLKKNSVPFTEKVQPNQKQNHCVPKSL